MIASVPTGPTAVFPPRYRTAEDWLRALGNVPLERILFNPWPGTATVADVIRLSDREKRGVELINGTLVEKPAGFLESLIASRIIAILLNDADARKAGLVSGEQGMIKMLMGNIRIPDVAFFRYDDLPEGRVPLEAAPRISPALAVEVLSPSNTDAEMQIKIGQYFENGVRVVWTLDPPTKTLRIHEAPERFRQLAGDDFVDCGDALPGFSTTVKELFQV